MVSAPARYYLTTGEDVLQVEELFGESRGDAPCGRGPQGLDRIGNSRFAGEHYLQPVSSRA